MARQFWAPATAHRIGVASRETRPRFRLAMARVIGGAAARVSIRGQLRQGRHRTQRNIASRDGVQRTHPSGEDFAVPRGALPRAELCTRRARGGIGAYTVATDAREWKDPGFWTGPRTETRTLAGAPRKG